MMFVAEKNLMDARHMMIMFMLFMFGCNAFAREHLVLAMNPTLGYEIPNMQSVYVLYLATCICYGSLSALIPLNCYRVFGPTIHQLLSFKMRREGVETSIQNHQVAVQLYEDFIYKYAVIFSISISFLLAYTTIGFTH